MNNALCVANMGIDIVAHSNRIGSFAQQAPQKQAATPQFRAGALLARKWCPRSRLIVVLFCVAHLLICCGEVEPNPGPEKYDQILDALKGAALSREKFHTELLGKIKDVSASITDINKRLSKVEAALGTQGNSSEAISNFTESVETFKTNLSNLSQKHAAQSSVVDLENDMNNRMRRKNLIIKGLPEKEKETYEAVESVLVNFCKKHLGVEITDVERAIG